MASEELALADDEIAATPAIAVHSVEVWPIEARFCVFLLLCRVEIDIAGD